MLKKLVKVCCMAGKIAEIFSLCSLYVNYMADRSCNIISAVIGMCVDFYAVTRIISDGVNHKT